MVAPTPYQRCLAMDTATQYLSVAVGNEANAALYHENVGAQQSALILPTIQNLLDAQGHDLEQLDLIVYAQGPGSFTGLRIGAGVAQGLSMALDVPLMGIPTLDVVASIAPKHPCVLAAIDARMGEVFYAWYNTESMTRLSDYGVAKPADITPLADEATCIGNALSLYADLLPSGHSDMPTAQDYIKLALSGRYEASDAQAADLLYVRNKIALTAKEQAQRKQHASS
ncbi:MAG: tRNA (adenosine(37)-N6)-threonylcarbamoyltransferase complex dimerization subunit type 1 TsaB [Neisseriaceae bacterium]|nr:tRNA (adenosine(37)-N6)-threonylcarbamoyltransferase complex dimerization subunit type 1 TsaB [Neisseriaceae bacterium]MBP6862915.1 tRNA (adenosine(37)-N6)-threonylcarbamoyltransferase complex dimerization subunit type 1 TsaB [Neisseriaceae bacterium]